MPFLDSILMECHDLLILGEYEIAAGILDKVCRLEFEVVEAPDSDEYAEKETGLFALADAAKERMLSRQLTEIGMDRVRAVIGRAGERGDSLPAREVIDLLETPICKNSQLHMLVEDELTEGRLPKSEMEKRKPLPETVLYLIHTAIPAHGRALSCPSPQSG